MTLAIVILLILLIVLAVCPMPQPAKSIWFSIVALFLVLIALKLSGLLPL